MKFNEKGILIECSIPFIIDLIPESNKTGYSEYKLDATSFTIHNPGNSDEAEDLTEYVDHTTRYVSWHFTVGQNIVIQELSIYGNAWHAGDGRNGSGNRTSLSMEVEENDKALATAIKFLKEFKKDVMDIEIVPHKKWTGKECPRKILPIWNEFIKEVEGMLTTKQKQSVLKSEGFYTGAIDGSYGPASQAAEKEFAEAKMEEIYFGNANLSLEDQVALNTKRIEELEKKY